MDIKPEQSMESTILAAAEKLFLEKGFKITSTTEIAKVVGCNQALIHYYFRTKENLFNTIFEQKFKSFFRGIINSNDLQNLTFNDKLKLIIESHYDMISKNPKMPALILTELSRMPEQLKILREKLKEFPERLFSELHRDLQIEIKEGRVREIDSFDLILSILSLNIAMFLLMPVAEGLLLLTEEQKQMMIKHRRKVNVDFILNSIRP